MSISDKLELKIGKHLDQIDENDRKKSTELCQMGKLLATYYDGYEIEELSESPDFIISNSHGKKYNAPKPIPYIAITPPIESI